MTDYERRRYEQAKPAYEALMKVYPFTLDDLPSEIWLPVPDYEGYQVSNFGRIKSLYGRWGEPCILKPTLTPNGYLHACLYKGGKAKVFSAHRLVARAFIPNPEGKREINHIDGHKFNNFVGNLEWCTTKENRQHAIETGLQKSGQDNYLAKLSNQQVHYIRENPDGLTICALADLFSVNKATISKIQRGERYKTASGAVRKEHGCRKLNEAERSQIKAEYVWRSPDFGSVALGKKYGVDPTTILNIIHE